LIRFVAMAQQAKDVLTKLGATLPVIAGIGGLAWLGSSAVYTVDAGHLAIRYSRLSGIGDPVYREGVHFLVPWLQRPIIFEARARAHQMSSLTGSRDLQMVNITIRCLFKPDPMRLPEMYRFLGQDFDERVMQSIVNEVLKSVVAQYQASALITEREKVSQVIRQRLTARAHDFNILLDDVSLTHIGFSADYEKSVESKKVAQQLAQRAEYLVIMAQEEKKRTIIEAEGETASAQMIGEAVRENPGFIELRKISVAKDVATCLSKSANRMVLSTESLLLNLMDTSSVDLVKANAASKK